MEEVRMTTRRVLDYMMINSSDPRDVILHWREDENPFPFMTEEMYDNAMEQNNPKISTIYTPSLDAMPKGGLPGMDRTIFTVTLKL